MTQLNKHNYRLPISILTCFYFFTIPAEQIPGMFINLCLTQFKEPLLTQGKHALSGLLLWAGH